MNNANHNVNVKKNNVANSSLTIFDVDGGQATTSINAICPMQSHIQEVAIAMCLRKTVLYI